MGAKAKADLLALAADLAKTDGFDRLSEVFIDSIMAVPVAGPIVAAVARQVLPRDSLIYLAVFAVEAAQRVEALEQDKLDRDYLKSCEFREDLEQVMDAQTLLLQRRKRAYFLAAIRNAARTDRPEESERRRMLDALVRFRPSHLRLLAVAVTGEGYSGPSGNTDIYLSGRMPDVPLDMIRLDWRDLQAEGMVNQYPSGMTMTPPPQLVGGSLTPYGLRFVAFVEAGKGTAGQATEL